jgi:hypothetical protein
MLAIQSANGVLVKFQWKALNWAKIAKIGAPRRLKNRGVLGYLGKSPSLPNPMGKSVWSEVVQHCTPIQPIP